MLAGVVALLLGISAIVVGQSQRAEAQDGPPVLESSIPFAGQVGVQTEAGLELRLTFNRAVAPATLVNVAPTQGAPVLADSTPDRSGNTISLTVGGELAAGTRYEVTGTAVAADDPELSEEFSFAFVTALDDETQFGIVTALPETGAPEIPVSLSEVGAVFNDVVATDTAPTLTLTPDAGDAVVMDSAVIDGDSVTFALEALLVPDRAYTAQIDDVAPKDAELDVVDESLTWTFTTGQAGDDGLRLVSSSPADGDQDVRTDLGLVTAGFDRDLDIDDPPVLTLESRDGGARLVEDLAGIVDGDDRRRVVFDLIDELGKELPGSGEYTITITAAAADAPGVVLDFPVVFRTTVDHRLMLLSSSPADGETDVRTDLGTVTARFNRELDTDNAPVLELRDADGEVLARPVVGEIDGVLSDRVTFALVDELRAELLHGVDYTISITAGAEDMPDDRRRFDLEFTTEDPPGIVLVSATPVDGADDVDRNLPNITGEFSDPLDDATITLKSVGPRILPIVSPDLTSIDPDNPRVVRLPLDNVRLAHGERYEATFEVSSGDAEASFVIAFSTSPREDPELRLASPIVQVGDPITIGGIGFEPSSQVRFTLREIVSADTFRSDETVSELLPSDDDAGALSTPVEPAHSNDADAPDPVPSPPTSTSATQQQVSSDAGGVQPRIYNGAPASIDDLPSVVYIENRTEGGACTGTIVADRWVLTAAHCFDRSFTDTTPNPPEILVFAGRDRMSSALSDWPEVHVAEEGIHHPSWNPGSVVVAAHDIALLRLATPTSFAPMALTAAGLPDHVGQQATVAGWGLVRERPNIPSDVLRRATVDVRPHELCEAEWSWQYDRNWLVCAGGGPAMSAACSGDSGGPLLVESGGTQTVIGIVNAGSACTAASWQNGVYTGVAAYRSWIEQTIATVVDLGEVTADATGTFLIDLPTADLSPGEYELVASEAGLLARSVSAPVTLILGATPEPVVTDETEEVAATEQLPRSGAVRLVAMAGLGGLAALFGVALLLVARPEKLALSSGRVVFTARRPPT